MKKINRHFTYLCIVSSILQDNKLNDVKLTISLSDNQRLYKKKYSFDIISLRKT